MLSHREIDYKTEQVIQHAWAYEITDGRHTLPLSAKGAVDVSKWFERGAPCPLRFDDWCLVERVDGTNRPVQSQLVFVPGVPCEGRVKVYVVRVFKAGRLKHDFEWDEQELAGEVRLIALEIKLRAHQQGGHL